METINLYIQPKMEQKCQAHNLKIVGSNPTPQPTYYTKPITYKDFKNLSFWGFFTLKFKNL